MNAIACYVWHKGRVFNCPQETIESSESLLIGAINEDSLACQILSQDGLAGLSQSLLGAEGKVYSGHRFVSALVSKRLTGKPQ